MILDSLEISLTHGMKKVALCYLGAKIQKRCDSNTVYTFFLQKNAKKDINMWF